MCSSDLVHDRVRVGLGGVVGGGVVRGGVGGGGVGRSLSALVKEDAVGPLARRLEIFLKVCDAVGYAHAEGVVHRDIKPGNVMVGAHGEVLLLDWGLAKVRGLDPGTDGRGAPATGDEPITRHDEVVGTPSYMAPEQARGDHEAIDERTDVFALGALLYALLTGVAPYPSDDRGLAFARVGAFQPPASRAPGAVPRELDAIVRKAMSAAPEDRYASVAALRDDVWSYVSGMPVSALRVTALDRASLFLRRHRSAVHVSVAIALVAAAAAGVGLVLHLRAQSVALDRAERAERDAAARLGERDLALALALADQGDLAEALDHLAAARAGSSDPRAVALAAGWLSTAFAPPDLAVVLPAGKHAVVTGLDERGERLAVITATGDQFLLDARSGLATAPTRSLPEMPGGAAARFAGDRLSVVGWSAGAWTWTDGATTRKIRGSAENRTDARALVTDGGVFVDEIGRAHV